MSPERKTTIGKVLIEEYYWGGRMVVYVDHYATDETFDQAVDRITKQQEKPHED